MVVSQCLLAVTSGAYDNLHWVDVRKKTPQNKQWKKNNKVEKMRVALDKLQREYQRYCYQTQKE